MGHKHAVEIILESINLTHILLCKILQEHTREHLAHLFCSIFWDHLASVRSSALKTKLHPPSKVWDAKSSKPVHKEATGRQEVTLGYCELMMATLRSTRWWLTCLYTLGQASTWNTQMWYYPPVYSSSKLNVQSSKMHESSNVHVARSVVNSFGIVLAVSPSASVENSRVWVPDCAREGSLIYSWPDVVCMVSFRHKQAHAVISFPLL